MTRSELFHLSSFAEGLPPQWKGTWGFTGKLQENKGFAGGASFILSNFPEEGKTGDLGVQLAIHRGDVSVTGLKQATRELADLYYNVTGGRSLIWDERNDPTRVAGVLFDAYWSSPK